MHDTQHPYSRSPIALAFLTVLLAANIARADSLTFAWDANPEPEAIGYYVYIGTSPGNYSTIVDVGNATSYTFTSAVAGHTYYVTVAAYASGQIVGSSAPELTTTVSGGPVLVNPGNRSNGKGVSLTLPLSASDPDGDPITFAAFGLPPGLSINPTTGVISGTPLTAGTFSVSVTAADPGAHVSTQTFTWTITATDVTAPTVTITSPTTGPTYTTAGAFVTLAGTASDDVGVTMVSWTNSAGGAGTAAGTSSWSVIVPVQAGGNVITITAKDASGKAGTGTLTVTTAVPLHVTSLVAVKSAPQFVGTAITFVATATNGVAPYSYKWLVFDGLAWKVLQNWTSSAMLTWTPTVPNDAYRIAVWVRSATSTADAADSDAAKGTINFPILASATPLSVTSLVSSVPSPQKTGTTITFTATASGGTAPVSFKWRLFNGVSWIVAKEWSTSNQHTWTPSSPGTNYKIEVWARSSGSTLDTAENQGSVATKTYVVDSSTPPPLKLVALTPTKTTFASGTTVTVVASASGGIAPYQYKWWLLEGTTWKVLKEWSTSSTFAWTANARGTFKLGVWVRSATSSVNTPDSESSSGSVTLIVN